MPLMSGSRRCWAKLPVPSRAKSVHQRLRTFVNFDQHHHGAGAAVIVFLQIGGGLHLQKAVGQIKVLDGDQIVGQQALVEAAVMQQGAGRLHRHAFANGGDIEIMIALHPYRLQLLARAAVNLVNDVHVPLVSRLLTLQVHGGVKVAFGLQVVAQVAAAFVQQVVVHRVFLVHRHQALQLALADLLAVGADGDGGAFVHLEVVIQAIALRMVVAVGEQHLGFQVVVLLVVLAQTLQRAGDVLSAHPIAGLQLGQAAHLVAGNAGIAQNADYAHARQFAGFDVKGHVHLARVFVWVQGIADGGLVVAVIGEHLFLALHRLLHFFLAEQLAQVELGGGHQLRRLGIGLAGSAAHVHVAVEVVLRDHEDDVELIAGVQLGFHLQAGEAIGGVQLLNALLDLGAVEGKSGLHRNHLAQGAGVVGAQAAEVHSGDGFALVLGQRIQRGAGFGLRVAVAGFGSSRVCGLRPSRQAHRQKQNAQPCKLACRWRYRSPQAETFAGD